MHCIKQTFLSIQQDFVALPQIHGHHPSPEAEDVCDSDKGDHWGDLGVGSSPGLSPVLLFHHGPAAREGRLLHRMARVHTPGLQKDVNLSFNYFLAMVIVCVAICVSENIQIQNVQ